MQLITTPPSILDVEASGFGSSSYPIEVGVARSDGEKFCRLIKPFTSWQHWDSQAENLHGISRQNIEQHGIDGREVCIQLNDFLAGQIVYSDGWVVDNPWLIKLYAEAGVVMSFKFSALEYLLSEQQMNLWQKTKRAVIAKISARRHRASIDAEVIQQTFVQTQQESQAFA